MKFSLVIIAMGLTIVSFAQKNNAQVILNKGQKFTVRTISTQEADMGMGMTMNNNTNSQNSFYVITANDKDYTISSTLTGLKVSMDVMGQHTAYDSDLKEDSASEIGKSIKNLNLPDTITLNKFTAEVSADKKIIKDPAEEGSNPMDGLFESLGDQGANMSLSDAFLVIPAGKKTGDSWIDSSSTKSQKTVKTYRIKSIDKNSATISVAGNVESNIQTETNGMQLTVTMNTKTDSEVISDIKTSLVSKRTTTAAITGTLEMMGQSLPITGKATTASVYEY